MPPKIRELIADREKSGFVHSGDKGSHRKFVHPRTRKQVVMSGKLGNDAKRYQIKEVKEAIKDLEK